MTVPYLCGTTMDKEDLVEENEDTVTVLPLSIISPPALLLTEEAKIEEVEEKSLTLAAKYRNGCPISQRPFHAVN